VSILYDGSLTPPTTAGSHQIIATIVDPDYQGGEANYLTIDKATASVTLKSSTLSQAYDGNPKSVTATTSPLNLTVTFTYSSSTYQTNSNPPSAAGSYTVNATIVDTNYQGNTSGTLVISSGYSSWESTYSFSGAPTDTPENDGVPNLLKYLYDINPTRPMTAADRAALPTLGVTTTNGTEYLTLTYRQNSEVPDLTITPQTSTDLVNWTSTPAPTQVGTDAVTGDPIMQVAVPLTGGKQFLRLQVSGP
jgi:hypothetical protein